MLWMGALMVVSIVYVCLTDRCEWFNLCRQVISAPGWANLCSDLIIIIIMVIFKCYFSRELIALS